MNHHHTDQLSNAKESRNTDAKESNPSGAVVDVTQPQLGGELQPVAIQEIVGFAYEGHRC